MRLHIGLISFNAGWQTLLQQEGVPFSVLVSPDELRVDDYSAVIVEGGTVEGWKKELRHYARQGGALVMSAESYERLFDKPVKRKQIRYLLGGPESPFDVVGLVDVGSRGGIVEGANHCRTDFARRSVLLRSDGDGVLAVLPLEPGTLVTDRRLQLKYFYSTGRRCPWEFVSLVSKGEVLKLVHTVLELIHHMRGLPYCHLSYFPDGAENVFALRIDSDYGTRQEIESLYRFAEEHKVKMSWYLHTHAHEGWLARFVRMNGHEIGVHCHEHAVLRSRAGSRSDLLKARDLLLQEGISPVGFAAPFGAWNTDLAEVTEELGFLYSSEFSFDYDNAPSYPWAKGRWSSVLQVPIHPICIGSFRRCGSRETEIVDYFRRIINRKLTTSEPLFFYHHPKDGHHSVLELLLESVRQAGVSQLLFRDFASWWNERLAASYAVGLSSGDVRITGAQSQRIRFRLTREGQETDPVSGGSFNFAKVRWRERIAPPPLPTDISRIRYFSPRKSLEALRISLRRNWK